MFTLNSPSLLILFAVSAMSNSNPKDGFGADKEKVVRDAVYNNDPQTVSLKRDFQSVLVIPKPLAGLYKAHPKPVVDVLLKVIDGGRPEDSVLAAGYAIELLDGPGGGLLCVEMFYTDKDAKANYDIVDEDWEMTPRQHWVKKIQEKMLARKAP